MSHILQEGQAFLSYAKYKTFLQGETPIIFYHDEGAGELLEILAVKDGSKSYFTTSVDADRDDFLATFTTAYDIGP